MWDRNASEFWVLKHDFGPHFWCQVSKVSKVSSVSTPKAKAKGKAKAKAKDAAIEKAECQKTEAPKVSWLKSLEILLHSLNKAHQGLTISKDEFMNSNFLYLSEFIERVVSYDILWLLSSFLTGFDPWILVGVFQDVAPPKPKPPLSHRIMWNTKGTGKFLRWDGVFNLWIDLKFRNQAMRSHSRTLVETLQSVGTKLLSVSRFCGCFFMSFSFPLIFPAHLSFGILLEKCFKELRKSGGFAARAAHFSCESFVSALSDQARDRFRCISSMSTMGVSKL